MIGHVYGFRRSTGISGNINELPGNNPVYFKLQFSYSGYPASTSFPFEVESFATIQFLTNAVRHYLNIPEFEDILLINSTTHEVINRVYSPQTMLFETNIHDNTNIEIRIVNSAISKLKYNL
ncbi:hypothetical protein PIROE2DRAFT_18041 [Piromyces sp. E2]|nr:hypothetical protein PIROE2DRAFT_18041 [Piromyces sp. E2]|eukprot:OUM57077.1 hypothetical protein PIROE2DRAFT_18041 [Piromyces sp. E2]